MDINYIGTYTLYMKETKRFFKVYNQTLFAPVVTALLFLAIFNLALGDRVKMVGEVKFAEFMAAFSKSLDVGLRGQSITLPHCPYQVSMHH